jgi:membrane protease YdiL (CAAX protease family)
MNPATQGRPSFWGTVRLLLRTARKRARGRQLRQRQLLQTRSNKKTTDWSAFGFTFFVLFMLLMNGLAAALVFSAVDAAQRVEVERQGKIVVSRGFFNFVHSSGYVPRSWPHTQGVYAAEAKRSSERDGGSQTAIEQKLRDAVRNGDAADLVSDDAAAPGIRALGRSGRLPQMVGSLCLIWWVVMLAFQGEGADMDVLRRRHPMWEWLFSHPVAPGAVFLAEMLSPIAANPVYWGAPIFAGMLYGFIYGPSMGFLALVLAGVPVSIAAACLGKALEIAAILRLPSRSRGAMIGLMSWLGYTLMMLFLVGLAFIPKLIHATSDLLMPFTAIPWPWLGLFLGARGNGFSFSSGILACGIFSCLLIGASVWFSVWGAQKGLSGSFASDAPGSSAQSKPVRFGRDPLYRKEVLWFTRDRSAIVQTILIPLSVAGIQVFNLRGILASAQGAWNYLCGVAIFFGTYFLWVLGPKSLQSEGAALWIPLTWPRGLESLLKAKAWLWSLISSGLVAMVLLYAALVFRGDIWKIALVGIGWFFFARSMAEKSVTLVTVTSSSGEPEKVSKGSRFAAQLGMLTFAVGIVTAQWQLAIIGIVYSYLTAAAMWQNFRARLPYLYDPWSEKLPPPPTLMHAMISISIMVELTAVVSIPILFLAGRENLGMARALGYGISAIVVSLCVSNFLRGRDVRAGDIWVWRPNGEQAGETASWFRRFGLADVAAFRALLVGACGGAILGALAHAYLAVMRMLPATAELMRKSQEQTNAPEFHLWYAIMAIGFAPFAEEYLFRGLLFRALDREWGGWRAVAGSAAFFAIYHPPLSWLPVALLGASNAVLFKKTGRLAPAVVLHMVYNAVVLL